ncbi:MAG: hypothetical protein ACJAU5_000723 [Maricaulis maris]|jgi:hypothetical protein|uniref:Uncharacterized protein n=1 Tax=Maricaulis maris (strain MCS10) TaxID=394221 RepID=Q0AM34_MARMM|nr:hypothetical protein [Maricaulis maris]ABI66659.1 hypothetical protein Mmar10_2367 [Maricaulis maris MCS10]
MAFLLPIALVVILSILFLGHRSRDGGLRGELWRIEQALIGAAENGVVPDPDLMRSDHLREAPEHLYRLIVDAFGKRDETALHRALAGIREYRAFRGWKA